jgi:hypothetical protein
MKRLTVSFKIKVRNLAKIISVYQLSVIWGKSILLFIIFSTVITVYSQNETIKINYEKLVDRTPFTHSGQPVGAVLSELKSQPPLAFTLFSITDTDLSTFDAEDELRKVEEEGKRIDKSLQQGQISQQSWAVLKFDLRKRSENIPKIKTRKSLKALVEPFLEPYAFLLQDALEAENPTQLKNPLTEVGDLFPFGEKQPAWANLLKTRRYLALSDGKGYVRIFLPGTISFQGNLNAKEAYSKNYGAVRHILNWLKESSTNKELNVDIYAYENDLTHQVLRLGKTPHSFRVTETLPPPAGTVPPDLKSIEDFLAKKLTLEGAYINDKGTLVLYGSKSATPPTLEGQPMELSDLAAAYRAVFYSGYNEPYISLDPSPFPEQVNVNFGGRLADTRIGWVTLRSDMRFKTLAGGADPATGEKLIDEVKKNLPDFQTQMERRYLVPAEQRPEKEYTRFWFYPNDKVIDKDFTVSRDEKFFKINKSRFIGKAVRESPFGERDEKFKTPVWTTGALDYFNRTNNYNAFAKMFPELRELDDVGRLLALFSWLKEKRSKNLNLDLDAFLTVELPPVTTPRRKSQIVVGYVVKDKLIQDFLNFSGIAKVIAEQRQSEKKETLDVLKTLVTPAQFQGLVGVALTKKLQEAGVSKEEIKELRKERYSAVDLTVGGGIDLSMKKAVRKLPSMPPPEENFYVQLKQSSPEIGLPRTTTQRVFRANVRDPESITPYKTPAQKPHQLNEIVKTSDVGRREIGNAKREIIEYTPAVEKVKWTRNAPENSFDKQNSKTVFFGGDGKPETFVRSEDGSQVIYKLDKTGDNLVAEKFALSKENEVALINGLRQKGDSDLQIWRSLPETTDIKAFEKMSDGSLAILRETPEKSFRLTVHDAENNIMKTFEGEAAITEMGKATRLKLETANTDEVAFVHAAFEDGNFILQVGKERKQFSGEEIIKAFQDPTSESAKAFDSLFNRQGDFIIYRDALARLPERFGKSLHGDTIADPVKLMARLRERFPGKKIFLDDEVDVAKENRKAIRLIARPADVGLLAPEESFPVEDHKVVKIIKKDWQAAGGTLLENVLQQPDAMRRIPNVILFSGHNDANLTSYLLALGEKGLLDGKVLFLNTCYARENPHFNNHLLTKSKSKPKAVFIHSEIISPVALESVLGNFAELLKIAETTGKAIHPLDLMEESIKLSLADEDTTPEIKKEITKLRRGTFQISWIQKSEPSKQAE